MVNFLTCFERITLFGNFEFKESYVKQCLVINITRVITFYTHQKHCRTKTNKPLFYKGEYFAD